MKLSRICALLAVPVVMVGCAAEEEPEVVEEPVVAEPAVAPVATEPAAGMGMEEVVNLTALNNSGVTGQATVSPMGGQTEVMVTLNAGGGAGGTTHQGHIHQGTCESPGSVVQPLQPITLDSSGSGSMTTTVSVDPNTVMNGQHIVVYHEAGGSPGQPIVCGGIPMHQM